MGIGVEEEYIRKGARWESGRNFSRVMVVWD